MSAQSIDPIRLEKRAERLLEDRDNLLRALVALRREHKLTQQELAVRMGVSQPTVAAFEHYDANPTLATLQRYAMAVGAVFETKVIDDCGEGVPSEWSSVTEIRERLHAPQAPGIPSRFNNPNYIREPSHA